MCHQVISSIEIIIEKISNRLFLKCLWGSLVQNMHFGVSGCGFPLSCRGRTIREMTRDVFVFQVTDQMKWYWKMCCFGEHITRNRNSRDGGTNESQVTTVRLSFKSSTRLQQHVADLQRRDFFFRKSCINLRFSANTMLSAAEFLLQTWFMRLWSYLHFTSPGGLAAFHFCINLIKTRVGGRSFSMSTWITWSLLLFFPTTADLFPLIHPPLKVHHISRPVFPPEVLFLLVFKNLKGSFIFQQSLVFHWVPVRQSLYFFFSWMDSRFILSPSNFVVQSLKRVQTEPIPERCSPHKPVLRHTSSGRRCVFTEGRKRLFLKLIWSLMFESPDLSVRFAARSLTTTRLNRISYRLWENNSSKVVAVIISIEHNYVSILCEPLCMISSPFSSN